MSLHRLSIWHLPGTKDEVTMVRTYLGSMKYTADEMFHPIGSFPAARRQSFLLKISLTEANVLILDEPTRNFSPLSGPEVGNSEAVLRAIISVSHDRKIMLKYVIKKHFAVLKRYKSESRRKGGCHDRRAIYRVSDRAVEILLYDMRKCQ